MYIECYPYYNEELIYIRKTLSEKPKQRIAQKVKYKIVSDMKNTDPQ